MATKPEFLVAREKMLVALETVSVAISSPVRQDIKSGCFRCVVQYHSMWATATFLLYLVKDAHFSSYSRLTEWAIIKMCVNTSYQRAYKTAFAVSGIQELWQKTIYFQEWGLPRKPSSRCHEQKKIMFSDIQDKAFSFKWHRKNHYRGNHFLHESFTTTCCWIS